MSDTTIEKQLLTQLKQSLNENGVAMPTQIIKSVMGDAVQKNPQALVELGAIGASSVILDYVEEQDDLVANGRAILKVDISGRFDKEERDRVNIHLANASKKPVQVTLIGKEAALLLGLCAASMRTTEAFNADTVPEDYHTAKAAGKALATALRVAIQRDPKPNLKPVTEG